MSCLAELTPIVLRQRYRVRYAVSSGEINEVAWLLPRGVLLRDGEVTADDLLRWSLEPLADGRQRLIVEFDRPQTGEFVVDVAGLQPPLGTAEQLRWEPWIIDAPMSSAAGAVSSKTQSFALGISSLPGFKVAPPIELDRTAPLSETAFVKSWGAVALTRQPQISFAIAGTGRADVCHHATRATA